MNIIHPWEVWAAQLSKYEFNYLARLRMGHMGLSGFDREIGEIGK